MGMAVYRQESYLDRIKAIKSERKITNDKLAEMTGIPLGTLSKLLAGISDSPKLSNIVAISEALDVHICKNLLLTPRNRSAFYLLCLPAENSFSTKDFSKLIGSSRLSFATEEDLVALLGCRAGSASVLGLMNDTEHRVTLAIDRTVAQDEWFGCHPCKNTSSLRLKTSDVLEKYLPFTGHVPTIVDL